MIETKTSSARVAVAGDTLRIGRRVSYPGAGFRGAAVDLRDTLHQMTGRAPWVTAVVAIWGEFDQTQVDGDRVTYVKGSLLADWLAGQPTKISSQRATELAGAVTALAERRRTSAAA